ncbi:XRE family transcriptional regulator [Nonomuraea jabiensis]|uniref:XRE family transcriptional regulator n=1 Tax=Nonomuraea jabiensis TaxID=882448 RepID=UPI003D72FFF5
MEAEVSVFFSVREVAMGMAAPEWAQRLRRLREERFDDPRQFVARLYEVADPGLNLPGLATMLRNLRNWESGTRPRSFYKELLGRALGVAVEVLFAQDSPRLTAAVQPPPASRDTEGVDPLWAAERFGQGGEFTSLRGSALFQAIVGSPSEQEGREGLERLAVAMINPSPTQETLSDLQALSRQITTLRQHFQACRYRQVIDTLTVLLPIVETACNAVDGDERLHAHALSSQAYHVAASVLLKHEYRELAWLAADRSVRAAHASRSALAIGASSRVITRALMDGEQHQVAADTARMAAQRMDAALEQPSADELSVYGSLLLGGAIAGAHLGRRHVVAELLDEADQAAQRLGYDGNHQWTAFGPVNVLCHRVNVALRLGDAGAAIDHARRVALDRLPTAERKGTVLIDTAQAFYMWGKHDKALHVLRAAEEIASEEVTNRPAALRLVHNLAVTAPPTVRRAAREYASLLGVPA